MSGAGIVELRAGTARVRLAPHLGGRITACELEGADGVPRAVLQPYPESHADLDAWAKGGLYPLIPYSGRLRGARLLHAGREWPLQPHAGSPHTLHGIAQRRRWQLLAQGTAHATLAYRHAPDAHWPWAFEARMDVTLAATSLSVCVTLRNAGDAPMPGGIGLHPYLLHDTQQAVRYDASAPWPFDEDYLALPGVRDASVGAVSLDPARFEAGEVTLFHGAWEGPLHVMDPPSGQPLLALSANGAFTQLVIHRPAVSSYLCVEPVSHVADGFNLAARDQAGTGTRVLLPGECVEGTLVMATSRSGRG